MITFFSILADTHDTVSSQRIPKHKLTNTPYHSLMSGLENTQKWWSKSVVVEQYFLVYIEFLLQIINLKSISTLYKFRIEKKLYFSFIPAPKNNKSCIEIILDFNQRNYKQFNAQRTYNSLVSLKMTRAFAHRRANDASVIPFMRN